MKFYTSGLKRAHASPQKWLVHFVGIGGIGMSGIAIVLNNLGYRVSGSDIRESETTRRLQKAGIQVFIGHEAENVKDASVVVVSSAVGSNNIEAVTARANSIPVIPRAEMLAELERLKYSLLVAGAHGKTTTTSLIAHILSESGLDPTVIIGGKLKDIGSNARLGLGEFLVAEADESDGSFLKLSPTIAVVTNIDREHMEYFVTMERLKTAFLAFMNKVPFYGLTILCADNPHIRALLPQVHRRYFTYGVYEEANLQAVNIKSYGLTTSFEALLNGEYLASFELPLPGIHNVSNALGAIAAGMELNVDLNQICKCLKNFNGIQRRFELKGQVNGIKVFDDYGHHPAEIKAAIQTMSCCFTTRKIVIFQPHRYSRTKDLLNEFYPVFQGVDQLILMDIYAASETPIEGVNSEVLFRNLKDYGYNVEYIQDNDEILSYLTATLRSGDILLTLGAGDVFRIGEKVLEQLNAS